MIPIMYFMSLLSLLKNTSSWEHKLQRACMCDIKTVLNTTLIHFYLPLFNSKINGYK
jgi:hypothetical protein